jgi:transcriptional regulator with XRE-family HTH domain
VQSTSPKNTIGEELRAARARHELTQRSLAAVSGVSPSAVRNFEQGHLPVRRSRALAAIREAIADLDNVIDERTRT